MDLSESVFGGGSCMKGVTCAEGNQPWKSVHSVARRPE
jgi:hypothetical protein